MGGSPLQPQIDNINQGIQDLKTMIGKFEERVRKVEEKQLVCSPDVQRRLAVLETDQKAHKEELIALKEIVKELVSTNRILKWIGGIITVVITALVIAVITGQATIVFK